MFWYHFSAMIVCILSSVILSMHVILCSLVLYRSIVFPCLLSRVLLYVVVIYTNYKVSWFDLVPLHNETILFRLVFLCAILHIFLFIIYVNVVFSKSNVVHVVCFLVSFPLYILCSEMTSSKQSEIKNLHSRHVDSQIKQSCSHVAECNISTDYYHWFIFRETLKIIWKKSLRLDSFC